METAIFRASQEVLTNIARHANASAVRIKLHESRIQFTMEIHDNGRGITKTEIRGARSVGLLSMREAVEPLGGTLSVTGHRGRGTRVAVLFPLRPPARRKMRVVRGRS